MEIIRAESTAARAGAYYVRIQAMAKKYHITLEQEFDAHDTPETKYILITEDSFPVATCRLYPIDSAHMMLGRIVVLPECRHRGLGSAAVRAAEEWTRALGYRFAVLEAREEKVGFYERLGYRADRSRVIRGETFTCIHMEKQL